MVIFIREGTDSNELEILFLSSKDSTNRIALGRILGTHYLLPDQKLEGDLEKFCLYASDRPLCER